jgi:hypothetical protein
VLKSLIVDGEDHTNDWSITDFTMAELKNWIAGTTYDAANVRPKAFTLFWRNKFGTNLDEQDVDRSNMRNDPFRSRYAYSVRIQPQ